MMSFDWKLQFSSSPQCLQDARESSGRLHHLCRQRDAEPLSFRI